MQQSHTPAQPGDPPTTGEATALAAAARAAHAAGRTCWLAALGLVLGVALVFGRAAVENFAFLYYDDQDYVFNNPRVTSGLNWEGVRWAFDGRTRVASNWHPLTMFSHMLDCQVYGLRSGWHHLTNILWHAANVLLLFSLLRRMTGSLWASALAAALFAWHPLHVESVAWISERKDLLCGFFWLLGTWCYVGYVRHGGLWRYSLVCGCLILGLLSKPMIVTFPTALMLLDYWPLGRYADLDLRQQMRRFVRLLLEKLPLLLIVLAGCLLTLRAQQTALLSWERLPLDKRLANAAISYCAYLGKGVWPSGLATPYPLDVDGVSVWRGALAALALLAVSALVVALRKSRPYLVVGWCWYLGTLVPAIGLVQVGIQSHADRYTYIPLIGIFVAVAWGLRDIAFAWPVGRRPIVAAAVAALIALGCLSFRQVGYWRDTETLLTRALDVTGENIYARYGLASAYRAEGQFDEALAQCNAILEVQPAFFEAYRVRGEVYQRTGRQGEAARAYYDALRTAQGRMNARLSTGLALVAARVYAADPDEENRDADRALELAEFACQITGYRHPQSVDALAAALAEAGRFDEAIARAEMAHDLARRANRPDLAARIARRIEQYRLQRPFRDDPSNSQF